MICPTHHIVIEVNSICEACHAALPPTVGLSLPLFDARNKARSERAFANLSAYPAEWWTNAMAGEAGEACNLTKKMSRLGSGHENWNKPSDQVAYALNDRLLREIGDVVIYASLLAQRQGSTLEECIRLAFNEKSQDIGSDILI